MSKEFPEMSKRIPGKGLNYFSNYIRMYTNDEDTEANKDVERWQILITHSILTSARILKYA